MPYRRILEELLSTVPGSRTALLLDAEGEIVVGAGELDDRHRLIGAYHGIALSIALRTAGRFSLGPVETILWRHQEGSVVLTALHDGYYLVLSIGSRTPIALAQHRSRFSREKLIKEI